MQIPSILAAVYADTVLVAVGQPKDLAILAKDYVVLVQPALAGIALMTILQRVLQAEGHILANFYISFIVFLLAPAIQYFLIVHMGYGLHGAGYAFSIYNCLYILLMVPYMVWADLGHVFEPRRETLNPAGMYAHLALAVPGLVCQLLEWASMELVSIIAGTRPSARKLIGALGMCLNLEAIFCMFAVGFMVAVSIKVGHAVGAGDAQAAKKMAVLGILAAFAWSLLISVLLFALRKHVVHIYTSDIAIADAASELFGPLGLLITLQAVNCTTQGVLTGAGLQRYTATCNLIGWYVVGAPLALGLIWGFDLDMQAGYVLLMSCCAAMLTSFLGQAFLLYHHDWDLIILESQMRMLEYPCDESDHETAAEENASQCVSPCHLRSMGSQRSLHTLSTGVLGLRGGPACGTIMAEQRSRSISLAQSMVSGYSVVSGNDFQLGTSPFMLQSPHPGALTFVVPPLPRTPVHSTSTPPPDSPSSLRASEPHSEHEKTPPPFWCGQ